MGLIVRVGFECAAAVTSGVVVGRTLAEISFLFAETVEKNLSPALVITFGFGLGVSTIFVHRLAINLSKHIQKSAVSF